MNVELIPPDFTGFFMRLKITPSPSRLRSPLAALASLLCTALSIFSASHLTCATAQAQENYKVTRSGAQYVHHIQLYDASGVLIDPTAPNAKPYSPKHTCMKCHDYKAISHGYHFNAAAKIADGDKSKVSDRPGEPWIYTDPRTGTQLPMSYRDRRDRAGLFKPSDAGLSRFKFLLEFGRQMPGGGVGEEPLDVKPETAPTDGATPQAADEMRFKISGNLDIDCMMCHSNSRQYSHENWIKQVAEQNFEWASSYALGIASVKGSVKTLPDDFDHKAEGAAEKLPVTQYYTHLFAEDKSIFLDIIRKPPNNACYQCHTTREVGESAPARWVHDQDVHIKAGIACADCHRNDIGHHTVRGFEGEQHPTGVDVHTLSCRGCHMDENDGALRSELGGRLGAPKPLHKGIPPVHFDRMSCTSCHSGPLPGDTAQAIQTSMAHAFGLANQTRTDSDLPAIVQPVFLNDAQGVLTPHRVVWPAYWAWQEGEKLSLMDSNEVYSKTLRRVLRIRSNFRDEASKATLTADERTAALGDAAAKPDADLDAAQKAKLDESLKKKSAEVFSANLAKVFAEMNKTRPSDKAEPVYVSGGKIYSLDKSDATKVTAVASDAGKFYAWPLAHDVRPARQSLGVTGCAECHAKDSPIFYSTAVAVGPAADTQPISTPMHELMGEDLKLLQAWEQSFGGRSIFKWVGFISIGAVALILVLFALLGLNGVLKLVTRR